MSDTDLESFFERDRPFSSELESETMARVEWMLTRHRAAFLAIALEQGINPSIAAQLSIAQTQLERVFYDFVSIGIDEDAAVMPIKHPLDQAYNDTVNAIVENKILAGETQKIIDTRTRVAELLYGTDEDLLHTLESVHKQL